MQDLFELTPELLLEQSREMLGLCASYESLLGNIASDLKGMNSSWSDLLANNFSAKIVAAQKAFSGALTMLRNSGESLRTVAETARETDRQWASRISGALGLPLGTETGTTAPAGDYAAAYETRDMGAYIEKLSSSGEAGHAEYALLCHLFQDAEQEFDIHGEGVVESAFILKLREYLPENHPLRNISSQQMQVTRYDSGFSAVTIEDGENALVIFAGTDFSKINDVITDAKIFMGQTSMQTLQAKELVDELSKNHSDIVVIGHSLGGYLATATALDNDAVSQCVAFDPVGRFDADFQNLFNRTKASKVKTYVAKGSPVSYDKLGHRRIGEVEELTVELSWENWHHHGIKEICDALGGEEAIADIWKQ